MFIDNYFWHMPKTAHCITAERQHSPPSGLMLDGIYRCKNKTGVTSKHLRLRNTQQIFNCIAVLKLMFF